MKIAQTFSILIWANATRGTQQGHALFARVTVNGRRAEISLKRKVDPARWNASSGQLKGSGSEARALNNFLAEVKAELYSIYHQMLSQEEFISAEAIKRRFTGQEKPRKTVLQAIRWHNEEVRKKIGTDFVKATATESVPHFVAFKIRDFQLLSLSCWNVGNSSVALAD
jgi:hypothetical protein